MLSVVHIDVKVLSKTMDRPAFHSLIAERLKALFKKAGSADTTVVAFTPEQIAHSVNLPFTPLQVPAVTIGWKNNLNFQHLYNLPRDALSGPIQDDKVEAYAALKNLVSKVVVTESSIDLREIFGLLALPQDADNLQSLEAFAARAECRHIRIISYRDFKKAITQALPQFFNEQAIHLYQASWLGPGLFWAEQQNNCAFACAVAYARLRGLELPKTAQISRYQIDTTVLSNLQDKYHMLIMPEQAWKDREFMTILLRSDSPYARLILSQTPQPLEVLLLPKHKPLSDSLGEGLKLAGAYDASDFLWQLP